MLTRRKPVLGYGPKDMESGDEIVVLRGGRAPAVLRPEKSRWLLIKCALHHALLEKMFDVSPVTEPDREVLGIRRLP